MESTTGLISGPNGGTDAPGWCEGIVSRRKTVMKTGEDREDRDLNFGQFLGSCLYSQ